MVTKPTTSTPTVIPIEGITRLITELRGYKVILDSDLAQLYQVDTKVLNRAVKRNHERFPVDFMFQLTIDEFESLRCQIGTSISTRGGRRYLPYAFTEHGILMLSSVLNSPRAVKVNIDLMRVFVQLRRFALTNSELSKKLATIEKRYDAQFRVVFNSIRELIHAEVRDSGSIRKPRRKIGFGRDGS